MSELNLKYENSAFPKKIWKSLLDNHNVPTKNNKEHIIEQKNTFENINEKNIHFIKLEKADVVQNEKEKSNIYFLKEREKCPELIKKEALEIPYIENHMNKVDQNQNLSSFHQELPKLKIIGQSHIEDFFSKLKNQYQNENKENNQNLNENYEKMNHKISSFEKISEQPYKPKFEILSNIPHPPSPRVGIVELYNFSDSLAQEFNYIDDIQLKNKGENDVNICYFSINTNSNNNINTILTFPEDTHNFEHHSDDRIV